MTPAPAVDLPTCPVARQPDQGRQFLTSHPLRRLDVEGAPGYAITVRMPSYRSLPLSCLVRIHVSLDGVAVPSGHLRLRHAGITYHVADLGAHDSVRWFVLDTAEVLVAEPLDDAEYHQVDVSFVTVEPYLTNGRFHRSKRASGRISVEPSWSA